MDRSLAADRLAINLSWLLKLRWVAVFGQVLTVAVAGGLLGVPLPTGLIAVILAAEALSNLTLAAWGREIRRRQAWDQLLPHADLLLGSVLGLDIVLLSALLAITGGAANPFTLFFLANLALAAVVLPARGAWTLTLLSVACHTGLFFFHTDITGLNQAVHLGGDRWFDRRDLRKEGMMVAYPTAAAVIVYFVTRVTAALARREEQLGLVRQRKARSEKLEALGTLAAGAAHELASPLSTIAVIAKELANTLDLHGVPAELVEDARLIRHEVDSCRLILQQMAADAGEMTGEALRPIPLPDLLAEIVQGLRDTSRLTVSAGPCTDAHALVAPRHALAQALRGLVKNALDATAERGAVRLAADVQADLLILRVIDDGTGIDPDVLARIGEPFFTTKETGKGMGLGLFLARSIAERLGGGLTVRSTPGVGTEVEVRLPLTVF